MGVWLWMTICVDIYKLHIKMLATKMMSEYENLYLETHIAIILSLHPPPVAVHPYLTFFFLESLLNI